MAVILMNNNEKLGISVEEAAHLLGVGKSLMLKLVTVPGFPAVRFKRKIIINKNQLQKWFDENCGTYGNYNY